MKATIRKSPVGPKKTIWCSFMGSNHPTNMPRWNDCWPQPRRISWINNQRGATHGRKNWIPTDSFRLWMDVRQLVALWVGNWPGDADESGPLQSFLAFTGIDQWQTFAFGSGCHGKHVVHQWSLQAKQSPLQVIGWGEQNRSHWISFNPFCRRQFVQPASRRFEEGL